MLKDKTSLNNQRGFMLLHVVFLTLVVATCAAILMNATPRARNPQALLRLTAIHLANEQLAILEGFAADNDPKPGGVSFLGEKKDLKPNNFGGDNPIKFTVETARKDLAHEKLLTYTVTVSWKLNGKDDSVTLERTVRVGEKVQAEENS